MQLSSTHIEKCWFKNPTSWEHDNPLLKEFISVMYSNVNMDWALEVFLVCQISLYP